MLLALIHKKGDFGSLSDKIKQQQASRQLCVFVTVGYNVNQYIRHETQQVKIQFVTCNRRLSISKFFNSIHFMLKLKGTYEKTNYVIFLRMLKILIKNTSRFMISLFQIIHMLLLAAEVHFEYTRLHCGASAKKAACVLLFYGNVSLLLNSKKFVIIF